MMHTKRRFRIERYATADDLAQDLAGPRAPTWTTCSGFRWSTLTLLNDSTCEDGAQEYAVVRDGRQVESLTVSWMEVDTLIATLTRLAAGGGVDLGALEIQGHAAGSCEACA